MSRCLYCYEELLPNERVLHLKCSRRVFSASTPLSLPYSSSEIAEQNSLQLEVVKGENRLRFVDEGGCYWLSNVLSNSKLPILEAVAMRMADLSRVAVAPHSLIRSNDGVFYHIMRSIDHGKRGAQIELMRMNCDLAEGQIGSYEMVAEWLKTHSTTPKLDVINLYERLLFCYLVGATELGFADFVIAKNGCGGSLAPAARIMPRSITTQTCTDMELTLNEKRSDLLRSDFESAMMKGGLEPKIIENSFAKFERMIDQWCDVIDLSPLSDTLKESFKFQIIIRFDTL